MYALHDNNFSCDEFVPSAFGFCQALSAWFCFSSNILYFSANIDTDK